MKRMLIHVVVAALWLICVQSVAAHPMTIKGTVVLVEKARLQVAPAEQAAGKPAKPEWYIIGPKTKIMRGDKELTMDAARIKAGEKVVLIVDHGGDGAVTVVEVRLAAR